MKQQRDRRAGARHAHPGDFTAPGPRSHRCTSRRTLRLAAHGNRREPGAQSKPVPCDARNSARRDPLTQERPATQQHHTHARSARPSRRSNPQRDSKGHGQQGHGAASQDCRSPPARFSPEPTSNCAGAACRAVKRRRQHRPRPGRRSIGLPRRVPSHQGSSNFHATEAGRAQGCRR
jgi:hypothetical protein